MASLTADDRGAARFPALSAGHYRVTASLDGRAASAETHIDGQTTLDLRLPDNPALRVRALDAVSSLPLPMISARVISARGETAIRNDVPGADGVFQLPSFAAQPMTVVLSARGYALKTLRGVMALDTPATAFMTAGFRSFTVQVSGTVQPCSFEVRDLSGAPIALSLDFNPGPVPLSVRNAVFYGMEAGQYSATLHDCSGKTFSHPMRLAPGLTPDVRFP